MRGYFIRVALAVGSLALLYYLGQLRFEALLSLYDRPISLLLSGLLLFATIPLGAYRWHLLLRCQGFQVAFRKTLAVVLVGQFFNTFLPGAFGGDIVRAGYIYHGARRQAGNLLLSILVDRLSGLAGLIAIGMAAQFGLPSVDLRITAAILVFVSVMLLGAYFLPAFGRLAAMIVRRLSSRLSDRVLQLSAQIGVATRIYMGRADILIVAVAISIFQFALVLLGFVVIASALDFVTATPATILYAGVVGLIASSIPLTPGGIGVGEAVFANAVILIDPLTSGPYATIFFTSRALTLLLSLLGGFVFLVYRSEVIEYTVEAQRHAHKT